MLPKHSNTVTVLSSKQKSIRSKNWNSYKKLWLKFKITRNEAKKTKDEVQIDLLKKNEIKIAGKLVKIAKTLTDKYGNPIAVPFFPILGNDQ